MLVCLIAIPLAALFGTRVPDLVKGLANHESDLAFLWQGDSPSEAPPLAHAAPTSPWGNTPGSNSLGRPDNWQAAPPAEVGPAPAVRAEYESPVDVMSRLGVHNPTTEAIGTTLASGTTSPRLVPVALPSQQDALSGLSGRSSGSAAEMDMATAQSLQASSEVVYIQRRLRNLGAAYYALETWGAQGRLFRFHARMSVGSGAGCLRHFEAVDADPMRAMAEVLDQVETWQATGIRP
jgi:hypothetical protein